MVSMLAHLVWRTLRISILRIRLISTSNFINPNHFNYSIAVKLKPPESCNCKPEHEIGKPIAQIKTIIHV